MSSGLSLASDQIDDVVDGLGLSEECIAKATGYAERADFEHPINRSPSAVAAGAVYLASRMVNEKRTQAVLSDSAGVSRVAIRNAYQEIAEHEGIPSRTRPGRETTRSRRGSRSW
ncbi:hypothetical protein EI982_14535 [Haloplanus rallus]|uniref:Cyclin-like domain-containing protein n=1 Tax=Haloplanus rallus TaxID=1816183 RepID=A0A6B9F5W4_9EURY|nr:hypothetical protein [Haloplanus rallus]QGX95915.1 hypothetical protein EI982_14535 [Haloplanus rallus]